MKEKKTMHVLREAEKTTHMADEAEKTTHMTDEAEKTTHMADEAEKTTHMMDEAEKTTHMADEAEKTTYMTDEAERMMRTGGEEAIMHRANVTERLFDQSSAVKEFMAVVRACEETEGGYQVVLDRTAFFPEGGGQAGDIGWLYEASVPGTDLVPVLENGSGLGAPDDLPRAAFAKKRRTETLLAVVCDTQEKNGIIYHRTDRPVAPGTCVIGQLDFEERFMRMQQHTAEHIISGIVHRLHGYDNVGFHLGADVTTLDFNGELTREQVQEAEVLANRVVFGNLPVEILYPTFQELEDLEYRSKIEIKGQVRIVSIPGVDVCACCAPHVGSTGEIGLIKILGCERHRGGCRMTMASGIRALADYQTKQSSVSEVSNALSAKPEEIGAAVLRQKQQIQKLREHLNQLQASYLSEKLSGITGKEAMICIFVEDFDAIAVRNFVNDAMERCSGICAAFVGNDMDGYRYIIGSRSADTRETAKRLNLAFEGKGGGKPEMVQGSLKGAQAEIHKLLAGQM